MTDAELHARLRANLWAIKDVQRRTSGMRGLEWPGVLAVGVPGPPVLYPQQLLYADPRALAPVLPEAEAWYRAQGIAAWRVPVTPGDTLVEPVLAAAGYRAEDDLCAMGRVLDAQPPPALPSGLTLERPETLDELLTLNTLSYPPPSLDYLAAWRHRPPPDARLHAVLVREGGRALAAGLSLELEDTAGVYLVATHPDARRRGLGGLLMRALHADAHARGCRVAVLQSTVPGRLLYQGLGYRDLGAWVNWVRRVEPDTTPDTTTPDPS